MEDHFHILYARDFAREIWSLVCPKGIQDPDDGNVMAHWFHILSTEGITRLLKELITC